MGSKVDYSPRLLRQALISYYATVAHSADGICVKIWSFEPDSSERTCYLLILVARSMTREQETCRFGTAISTLGPRAITRGFAASVLWACPQGAIRLGCYGSCARLSLDLLMTSTNLFGMACMNTVKCRSADSNDSLQRLGCAENNYSTFNVF